MRTTTATKAKTHFGELLDNSAKEPILIERSGRQIAVIMSYEEYQQLLQIEDNYWLLQAKQAEKQGYIGPDKSTALLDELLNDED